MSVGRRLVIRVGVDPESYIAHQAFIERQVASENGWWMVASPRQWREAVRATAVRMFGANAASKVSRYRELAERFVSRVGVYSPSQSSLGGSAVEWAEIFASEVDAIGGCDGCIAPSSHSAWAARVAHIDVTPPLNLSGLPSAATIVPMTRDTLMSVLDPLMHRCTRMAVCDPYLGASLSARAQRAVAELVVEFARRLGDRGPLLLNVGKAAGTVEFVRSRLVSAARARQDDRSGEVNLVSWSNVEDGAEERPHQRWICTSRGGVMLNYGLQDFVGEPRDQPLIRLSSAESEELLDRAELQDTARENDLGWLYHGGDMFEV